MFREKLKNINKRDSIHRMYDSKYFDDISGCMSVFECAQGRIYKQSL